MNDSAELFHNEEEQPLTQSKDSPAKCRRKRPPKKCLSLDEPSLDDDDDHSDHSVQLESGGKNKVPLGHIESYSDSYHIYTENFKMALLMS